MRDGAHAPAARFPLTWTPATRRLRLAAFVRGTVASGTFLRAGCFEFRNKGNREFRNKGNRENENDKT
jgi:hypothetical protein